MRMTKSSFALWLLLAAINACDYFAMGQNTVGDCSKDEQNNDYSDLLFALANSMHSEFQNLKAQISRLENRVERQKLYG